MNNEPTIYDAKRGTPVPLGECGHMDEAWLDDWSCLQTTLDALAAARYWESKAAQLTTSITAKAEAAAKEIAEFEYDAHGYRVGTDTIELIINGKFTQEARP